MPAKAKAAKTKPNTKAKAKAAKTKSAIVTKAKAQTKAKPTAKRAPVKGAKRGAAVKKPAPPVKATAKPVAAKPAKNPAVVTAPSATAKPAPAPARAPVVEAPAPVVTPDVMPAFRLAGSDGKTWDNASLAGLTYVLYFYPKDATPGCTVEACNFRDNLARLQSLGVTVLGVSPDSLASHASFIAKEHLNFPLLADENHALAEALGSWTKKSMYGREFMGINRSTFLVDGTGRIRKSWRSVSVAGHVDEVIAAVEALAKG